MADYHPIRTRMLWVVIVNTVASGLVLAGIGAEVITGWVAWLGGVLDILVLAGVLYKGALSAEANTTPIDSMGVPLNPEFTRTRTHE